MAFGQTISPEPERLTIVSPPNPKDPRAMICACLSPPEIVSYPKSRRSIFILVLTAVNGPPLPTPHLPVALQSADASVLLVCGESEAPRSPECTLNQDDTRRLRS